MSPGACRGVKARLSGLLTFEVSYEMVMQLNVFAENKPGKLEKITGILADANVNIKALKISSENGYGVFQFIVDNPEAAFRAFKQAGITVSQKDVLAVVVDDKPGSLHHMLGLLREDGIDVADCYGFVVEREEKAIIVLEVSNLTAARRILERQNYNVIGSSELYSL
ncbi:MAG: ACT domain-containing protein [Methanophagales archaeon ANME-1-THS]|nr:MAG: ACT domain-containing protein [Methanophagales archaeon ANME-1-THS]